MITQKANELNEINEINEINEVLSNVFHNIPIILATGKNYLLFLIKDLEKKLDEFIITGKTEEYEFQVFSNDDLKEMETEWEKLDLTVTYHSQQMEYMQRKVTVTYPQVSDLKTDIKISLIPWFLLPGRPYPLFAYIYALWHYHVSDEKSQRLSAAAAAKLFGIEKFDKSTVCRNIKAMKHLFDTLNIDRPLSTETRDALSKEDLIGRISKMIKDPETIEKLKKICGNDIGHLSEADSKANNILYALNSIPNEHSKMIKKKEPIYDKPRDVRKRKGRLRAGKLIKHNPVYVKATEIEAIRNAFILSCRSIVMDAAITYHQSLIGTGHLPCNDAQP